MRGGGQAGWLRDRSEEKRYDMILIALVRQMVERMLLSL